MEKDTFEHLDKLNTPSKFIIVTKLVWGNGLDKGSHNFERLQKLFRLRNNLAHPKPSNKGNLFDTPLILQNPKSISPNDSVSLILDILKLFNDNKQDDVTEVLLKQIIAWLNVAKKDLDFYPIPSVNTPFLTQHLRRIIKPPAYTQQVSYH